MRESPIFLKSFEVLVWLLDHTRKFPKHQRFVMAKRMEEAALGFGERNHVSITNFSCFEIAIEQFAIPSAPSVW